MPENDGRVHLPLLPTRVRPQTLSARRFSKRALERGRKQHRLRARDKATRPHTVDDCHKQGLGTRGNPCLWVSCPYHLYLDVDPETGSLKLNFPDKEVWELEETCCLHVAEQGSHSLEETCKRMNLTRERVRQIERKCFGHLRDLPEVRAQGAALLPWRSLPG